MTNATESAGAAPPTAAQPHEKNKTTRVTRGMINEIAGLDGEGHPPTSPRAVSTIAKTIRTLAGRARRLIRERWTEDGRAKAAPEGPGPLASAAELASLIGAAARSSIDEGRPILTELPIRIERADAKLAVLRWGTGDNADDLVVVEFTSDDGGYGYEDGNWMPARATAGYNSVNTLAVLVRGLAAADADAHWEDASTLAREIADILLECATGAGGLSEYEDWDLVPTPAAGRLERVHPSADKHLRDAWNDFETARRDAKAAR